MTAMTERVVQTAPDFAQRNGTAIRVAIWCLAALMVIGLFGRVMSFPLSHDEQIHVVAARFFLRDPLYGTLGYNHLPGLPLLLGSFYAATGSDHFLQAGRVLVFFCWMASAAMMWLIARRHTGDSRVAVVAILALAAGTLLGPAGMLVTNNFLPIPFALLGVHLLIVGLEGETGRPALFVGAGIAIGFAIVLKISYVFLLPPVVVAALTVPKGLLPALRLRLVLLPLLAGGLVGGLPVLVVLLSDPAGLIAHTVTYFTGGHLAYWQHSTEPKAMTLAAKMLVAEDVWLAGGSLLAVALAGTAGLLVLRGEAARLRWWPIAFVAAIAACAAAVAFAPTPAFPQYYEPVVPFLIVLFVLVLRQLDDAARALMQPLLTVVAILAVAIAAPRIVTGIPAAARPSQWTGTVLHADGGRLRAALAGQGVTGKVATLAPIVAVEGGLPIYPEFAAGPFLYRVAEYLPAAERAHFRTTSPEGLVAFLDADPPAAIVTGREALLDPAFAAYARARGYRAIDSGTPATQVFVRPRGIVAAR